MSTLIALAALSASLQSPSIEQFVQKDLHDATFVARVVKANQRELMKINKDFGQSYRFDSTTIRLKEPFKLRLEARVEDTTISYVINGAKQSIRLRGSNIVQDLSEAPGRRQTMLDFGILTPSLFDGLFVARFVRNDRATGDMVFDLTYPARLDDTTRHRIWVDKDKGIVDKREWYNQYNRLVATFLYEVPKQEKGVWMPTRLTVKNVDGVAAGVTRYDSIKVNTGLSDDLFSIR